MKLHLLATVALAVALSPATAAVVDNGTYTTDTNLGLDYLDVGLVFDNYAAFNAGYSYAGRTWVLATAAQIASTWSDATGLSLTATHILAFDNDMGFAATNTLISLFDGVTSDLGQAGERVIGNYNVAGYYNFISGGSLSVHDQFDDSHFSASTSGVQSAWLVSPSTPAIPEPGSFLLLGSGLAVSAVLRFCRK